MLIPAGSGDKLREKEDKEHEYKKTPASLIKRSGGSFSVFCQLEFLTPAAVQM